jgi:hypothetical protein
MIDIVKVIRVEPLDGFRLSVRFSDGTEGVRDFSDVVAEGGPMLEALKEPKFFRQVFVELGTLTWPNGFDLDSIALHDEMKAMGVLRRSAA